MARRTQDDDGIAAFLCEVGWNCPAVGWAFSAVLLTVAAVVHYVPWPALGNEMTRPLLMIVPRLFAVFCLILAALGAVMAVFGTARCLLTGRSLFGQEKGPSSGKMRTTGAAERSNVGRQGLSTNLATQSGAATSKATQSNTPACPACGARMAVRSSARGPFWGYSTYGQTGCRGIVRIAR